jgi:branched-chain amino acid transport system ATP-binding protein
MVEQNANMALQVADRAYVLQIGQVVLSGPAAELRETELIRQAYLGALKIAGPAEPRSLRGRQTLFTTALLESARAPRRSFPFGFAAPLGKKRIYRGLRLAGCEATGERLSLRNDFFESPDPKFAPDELDDDVAPRSRPIPLRKPAGMLKHPDFETLT